MSEELIISPEEAKKRRTRKPNEPAVIEQNENKIYNKAGGAFVQYESQGRFDTVPEMGFKDFSTTDVHNITLSRREDLFENIVTMVNKNRIEQEEMSDVKDMVTEEFLETLIAIKKQFSTAYHQHFWLCECQHKLPESEQKTNMTQVNLNTIKYQSIAQADEEFRKDFRKDLEMLSPEEWAEHVKVYYKGQKDPNVWTIDDEVNAITIREPIRISDDQGNVYEFRLTRVKDLIEASRLAQKEYGAKIAQVQNRQTHNIPLAEVKAQKQTEIDQLEYEKEKAIILYAKAFSLVKYNDKVLTTQEKIKTYSDMPRSLFLDVVTLLNKIKFGVCDEIELSCPICGKISKESLRQELDILQLLPLDPDSGRDSRKLARLNFSFGD